MAKQDTALNIRTLANLFQHMQDAADTLDQIGSLENAAKEAQAATAAARKQRDDMLAEVVKAEQALNRTEAEIRDKLAATDANLKGILTQAKLDAQKIKADVEDRAEKEAAKIKAAAEKRWAELTKEIAALTDQKLLLDGDISKAIAARDAAEAEAAAAEKKVADIRKKLASFLE